MTKNLINCGIRVILLHVVAIALGLLFTACTPKASSINYGMDACTYCRMNIVDKQHGAELVTRKGKVYKFDAIECMLSDLKKREPGTVALFLVNTYDSPIDLHDATTSTFLISEAIPSPMGANLSAFSEESVARQTQKEKGGSLYDWPEIMREFAVGKQTAVN